MEKSEDIAANHSNQLSKDDDIELKLDFESSGADENVNVKLSSDIFEDSNLSNRINGHITPKNFMPKFEDSVTLDPNSSHLDIVLEPSLLTAQPSTEVPAFSCLHTAIKATHGICPGQKAYYDVTLDDIHKSSISNLTISGYSLTIGFSELDSPLIGIGKATQSFGFNTKGLFYHDGKVEKYGKCFGKGDKLRVYIDYSTAGLELEYLINGESQGKLNLRSFKCEKPIYPHFMTKNVKFSCDFGNRNEEISETSTKSNLNPNGSPNLNQIFANLKPSQARVDETNKLTVIMLVGFPGSGKSEWAFEHCEKNKEMMYNIIGVSALLQRIFDISERFHHIDDEDLLESIKNCCNYMIKMAPRRRCNIILDDHYIHNSKRRKTLSYFPKILFYKSCQVFILPARIYDSKFESSKAINYVSKVQLESMKQSFSLPCPNDKLFDSIFYQNINYDQSIEELKLYKSGPQISAPTRSSKVTKPKYFKSNVNKPALLNVNPSVVNSSPNNFKRQPNQMYNNKGQQQSFFEENTLNRPKKMQYYSPNNYDNFQRSDIQQHEPNFMQPFPVDHQYTNYQSVPNNMMQAEPNHFWQPSYDHSYTQNAYDRNFNQEPQNTFYDNQWQQQYPVSPFSNSPQHHTMLPSQIHQHPPEGKSRYYYNPAWR